MVTTSIDMTPPIDEVKSSTKAYSRGECPEITPPGITIVSVSSDLMAEAAAECEAR
jgi:hypothetical protein